MSYRSYLTGAFLVKFGGPQASFPEFVNYQECSIAFRPSRIASATMWTYIQKSGRLLDANLQLVGIGYSGHDVGKNNPAMQSVSNTGPLPCGVYDITERF